MDKECWAYGELYSWVGAWIEADGSGFSTFSDFMLDQAQACHMFGLNPQAQPYKIFWLDDIFSNLGDQAQTRPHGGLRSTEEAFLLPTLQPWVWIHAPLIVFLFTALFVKSIEIKPI